MAGKYLDLDLDKNLGGNKPSDTTVPSQAAIKSYVDNKVSEVVTEEATWGNITGTLDNQIDLKQALDSKANTDDLATVATSGNYSDLTGTPTNVSTFTNDAGYLTEHQDISGKADKIDTYTKTEVDALIPDVTEYDTHIANTDIHVTALQKTSWTNKQDAIEDLATIRTNAQAGKTASTTIAGYGDIVTHNADEFATATHNHTINDVTNLQTTLNGKQDTITEEAKLSADLVQDGLTNKVVTSTEKATWNSKQDTIADLSTIRNNATAGKTASDTIATYGDIVTHNASEFLTEHQDISGKQDKITETNKLSADLLSEGLTNKLVTEAEKTTWSGKQDVIADLTTIRSNATTGANAATTIAGYGNIVTHNVDEFAESLHNHTVSDITDLTIPTVNDSTITIQKNGVDVDSFTTNQALGKTINLAIPVNAADVSALPNTTKYAKDISLTIDPDTFIITLNLKDQDGTVLKTQTIDLPLESVVVSGSYVDATKTLVLTLQNGGTIEIPVENLVAGLQKEITETNKLSADLIKDGLINSVVTASDKTTWNGKQDAIADLTTIRSNATSGKQAADTISGYGDIVTHNVTEFAEAEHTHTIAQITNLQSTLNGKQETITSTNKLDADLLAEGLTNKLVSQTEKDTWNAKQDTIADLASIRSGAGLGATAVQPSDLGAVATSNSYTDLDNKPFIPTVTDTYSATSSNAMSGKAVASAISGLTQTVITFRSW